MLSVKFSIAPGFYGNTGNLLKEHPLICVIKLRLGSCSPPCFLIIDVHLPLQSMLLLDISKGS